MYVERSRELLSDEKAHAEHERLACAQRRSLAAFAVLAPLTGLAGPLWAAPALGMAGWGLTGLGLLACVLLLFRLARQDADMNAYEPLAARQVAQVHRLANQHPHVDAIVKNARRTGRRLYQHDFGWISLIPASWQPGMEPRAVKSARKRPSHRAAMVLVPGHARAARHGRQRPYRLAH